MKAPAVGAHVAPDRVIRQVVEVNLLGALLYARRAAQIMSTNRGGPSGRLIGDGGWYFHVVDMAVLPAH